MAGVAAAGPDDWITPQAAPAPVVSRAMPAQGVDDWIAPDGRGDMQPMAPGAVQHAMPASSVSGGPTPEAPSAGQDIANAAVSRTAAGALDIPGMFGDLRDLAKNSADLIAMPLANGIRQILGKPVLTPQEQAAAKAAADVTEPVLTEAAPNSGDVKKAVGFQAYQPQTGAGQTFDKWVGPGIEAIPSLVAGGMGGGIKQAVGDVMKYAVLPGAAGEAAGELTKGTPLEPYARLAAQVAVGGRAAAREGEGMVRSAPDPEVMAAAAGDLKAAAQAKYGQLKDAGMVVHPSAYDAAIDNIAQDAAKSGIYPSGSSRGPIAPSMTPKGAQSALDELMASKGSPKTWEQLDQLHSQAGIASKSLDPAERRMGAIIASHIDDMMDGLKFGQVSFTPKPGTPVMPPADAFKTILDARSTWRAMRNTEKIANLVQQAKDKVGANYTSAGFQTGLRQVFRSFKGQNKNGVSKDFRMLDPESQSVVNSIIRGAPVENALRMVGKMHAWVGAFLGHMFGGPIGAAGLPIGAGIARTVSARQTFGKVNRLADLTSGAKGAAKRPIGATPLTPMAVFYGLAAQRAAEEKKQPGQQPGG